METEYQIISLFPIPVYITEIPEFLVEECIPHFDQEPLENMSKEYGSRSKNSYLLNEKKYENLSKYILQQTVYYAENIYTFNYTNYKFSQSWLSQKAPNELHAPHIHHNSLISGVMYYGNFNKTEISPLVFKRHDLFSQNYNSHKNQPINSSNQFSSISVTINVKPNILILFPSTLTHSVPINNTSKIRKSLAFNVVPRDGFGEEEALSELKFNN